MSHRWKLLALTVRLGARVARRDGVVVRGHGPDDRAVVRDPNTITLVEVDRFSVEQGAVILKKVRDLRGKSGDGHEASTGRAGRTTVDRSILAWAEPGRRSVLFMTDKTGVVCVGEGWYQSHVEPTGGGRSACLGRIFRCRTTALCHGWRTRFH